MKVCVWQCGFRALALAALLAPAIEARAQQGVDVEAFSGQPFGVGRITLQIGPEGPFDRRGRGGPRGGRIADLARRVIDRMNQGDTDAAGLMRLTEAAQRVFYPAYESGGPERVLRGLLPMSGQKTVFFLFQGDQPLQLTLYAPVPYSATVAPKQNPAAHQRLLAAWWRQYRESAREGEGPSEYPPVVEIYLTSVLAGRLRLPASEPDAEAPSTARGALGVLLGAESSRLALERRILRGEEPLNEAADQSLPSPVAEPLENGAPTPDKAAKVDIEAIAMHVPEECLYLRFGTFSNFLWLRHRTVEWGGELRDIIANRGVDYGLNERQQRQLVLRESALAALLGPTIISDVAIIGTDTFLREGASIGVLFEARSGLALESDITSQRADASRSEPGIVEEKLLIDGREVSFLHTPDNRVRSFYVIDGDYHLVTTSRYLVQRFLETGHGHRALGALDAFRDARSRHPAGENDTMFIYLSEPFFRNLLTPQYQIEMRRRWRSDAEIVLYELARLTAQAEGQPDDSIEGLVARGYLPARFGQRPDGSKLELVEGRPMDSLRGGRGTFVPVPDLVVERVTSAEAREYGQFVEFFGAEWQQVDPVLGWVRRQPGDSAGLEQVSLDLQAVPLAARHYERLARWIGPPSQQRLRGVQGDLASGQVSIRGSQPMGGGVDYYLFGGVRDADPARELIEPRPTLLQRLLFDFQNVHGYFGAWPHPGLLRTIGGASDRPSDPAGYSRMLTGLWRRQWGQFTVMSFHPSLLAEITPQLVFEAAQRPSQLWLRVADLRGTGIGALMNTRGYQQAMRISQGNSTFLNRLIDQLHVPADKADAAAKQILNARLISPLGGQYELRNAADEPPTWTSTALVAASPGSSGAGPAGYVFPALRWLRRANVEARMQRGDIALHADLVMSEPGSVEQSSSGGTPRLTEQKPSSPDKPGNQPSPVPGFLQKFLPPAAPPATAPPPPTAPQRKPAPEPLPEPETLPTPKPSR